MFQKSSNSSHPHFSRSNKKVNYLPSNVGAKIRLQHHGPVNRDRRTTAGSQLQGSQCYRCLGRGHSPDNCHFKTEKCFSCQKEGHIQRDCRSANQRQSANLPAQSKQPLRNIPEDCRNLMNMKIFH